MDLQPVLQQSWQELRNVSMLNIFLISLVLFASIISLSKLTTKRAKLNLPPSPPKLPIIGNLHQIGKLPHHSFLALSKKYGPIMLMNFGYHPTVVISSAELVKEMTKLHDVTFSSRPNTTGAKLLLYGSEDVVFAPYGEHWRQARKICVNQLLTTSKVQSFKFVREEEVSLVMDKIRHLSQSGSKPVNMSNILLCLFSDIMIRCVLGETSNKEEDGKKSIAQFSKRIVRLIGSVSFGDFFPYLGWIDLLTGLIPNMKNTFVEWNLYFDQLIEERKFVAKSKDRDFVDILLHLQLHELGSFYLTQNKMKALLLDMIVAGSETSSTTTEWMMAQLVRNPRIMTKAQEEVRRVVGQKTKVDESDIEKMEYLKCVIKETLRLSSPVPLMIPRETLEDVKLGGYDIPAKTRVFVNTWAIQRDPIIWGDNAEEFSPERFENNPIDFKGQDFEYLPFGVGRRGCPGISFGIAAVEYAIASLLYHFDWVLPQGTTPQNLDMNEVFNIANGKKVPLHLIPILHSSSKMT